MSREQKVKLIKYGGASLFCAVMAILYIVPRNITEQELVGQYLILCDAFTVPGILLIMFGFLVLLSNSGALDGISYALQDLKRVFIPGAGLEKHERYSDYVERRRQKKATGYGFLFVVGGICTAIALVFMALFYSVYG